MPYYTKHPKRDHNFVNYPSDSAALAESGYKKLRLVWNSNLPRNTKLRIFHSTFIPIRIYGLDTLTLTDSNQQNRRVLSQIPQANRYYQCLLLLQNFKPCSMENRGLSQKALLLSSQCSVFSITLFQKCSTLTPAYHYTTSCSTQRIGTGFW